MQHNPNYRRCECHKCKATRAAARREREKKKRREKAAAARKAEAAKPKVFFLIGPPGCGKTRAVLKIMGCLGPFTGEVFKKTSVRCAAALDRKNGIACIGRFKCTHGANRDRPDVEGCDRLARGRETGTWSCLLQEGMSKLSECRVVVLDSCDPKVLHRAHIRRLEDAGWHIAVREITTSRVVCEQRCQERDFGSGALTGVEIAWNDDFDYMQSSMQRGLAGLRDHRKCSAADVVKEVCALCQQAYTNS